MKTPFNTRQTGGKNSKLFSEHLAESRFKYFINFLATGFLVNHLEFVSVHFFMICFAIVITSSMTYSNKQIQTNRAQNQKKKKKKEKQHAIHIDLQGN